MKKTFFTLIFLGVFLLVAQVRAFDAKDFIIDSSGVYVKETDVKNLQELFDRLEFPQYLDPDDNIYPRIFVQQFPLGYVQLESKTYRNEMFIKILMPLVLKINQEYEDEHKELLAIEKRFNEQKDFNQNDSLYIEQLAQKYEIATPYKDTRKHIMLLEELLLRADGIPPSILIAAAAIYTDWGTSRLAIEGNNLYKAKNWYSDEGLKPLSDDKDYRYKVYNSLEDSIRDYILRVNQNVNFKAFWQARQYARKKQEKYDDIILGKRLDWSFVLDNNLKNYAGLLDYTLTYYRMHLLDGAIIDARYDLED
ncbi:MAG: glucosaminidase domain-containing protein [Alphaproteobacteria bacterium]|nr:glucosaminidase domain-containing protein [Alphaproteobacteria bacterium]